MITCVDEDLLSKKHRITEIRVKSIKDSVARIRFVNTSGHACTIPCEIVSEKPLVLTNFKLTNPTQVDFVALTIFGLDYSRLVNDDLVNNFSIIKYA